MFGMLEAILSFLRRQIGLRTDSVDSSGSLHAKVGDVKSYLETYLDTKISSIQAVRSVQRGILIKQTIDKDSSVNVTISSVDTSKSVVILSTLVTSTSGSIDRQHGIYARLTSSTNLRFTSDAADGWGANSGSIAWQVIEFV